MSRQPENGIECSPADPLKVQTITEEPQRNEGEGEQETIWKERHKETHREQQSVRQGDSVR